MARIPTRARRTRSCPRRWADCRPVADDRSRRRPHGGAAPRVLASFETALSGKGGRRGDRPTCGFRSLLRSSSRRCIGQRVSAGEAPGAGRCWRVGRACPQSRHQPTRGDVGTLRVETLPPHIATSASSLADRRCSGFFGRSMGRSCSLPRSWSTGRICETDPDAFSSAERTIDDVYRYSDRRSR